ncbi:MAG: GntR family transcriptional regulator [Nocardioidaceae bacterium]
MISEVARDALTDRSYDMLRDRIIDGRLAAGERLQIARLSADLGVSQTPVREALNRLTSDRLVSLAPYRGFSVAPLLDADNLVQLFEARRVIELGALQVSVVRATEQDSEELGLLLDKLDDLAAASQLDISSFNELDAAFHRATVALCGNTFLLNAYDDLHIHVQIARHYRSRPVGDARRAQSEHRAILAGFTAGDRDALLEAASTHISTVCNRLVPTAADDEKSA